MTFRSIGELAAGIVERLDATLHAPGLRAFLQANAGRPGCWPWPKWLDADGYGRTKLNGKTAIAHRVAYQMAVGAIPEGLSVLHSCDNPACCNPGHLFLGTQKDNCQDAKAKDRHSRGERNGSAKLTADDVRAIRASQLTQCELAERYGVRQTAISAIITRRNWSHV